MVDQEKRQRESPYPKKKPTKVRKKKKPIEVHKKKKIHQGQEKKNPARVVFGG